MKTGFSGALFWIVALSAACANQAEGKLPLRAVLNVPLGSDTSRLDYESLDAGKHLLFIAHLGASQVIVVDTKAYRVVATISSVSEVHGVLVVPALHRAYASATGKNQIAVIDERSFTVIARVPGGTYPDGMAFVPEHHKLYVSDEHGGTETVIDTDTNERVATIPLGGDVGNTQYDSRTKRIFVNVQTRGDLVTIDPESDRVIDRHPISGCQSNHGLLIDDDHRFAYVACEDNATLVVFDLRTLKQRQTLTVGSGPDVLAYDRGRATLYVASESGNISVFTARKTGLEKVTEGFLAKNAHVVGVDERSHRVYFPLRDVEGAPLLRVMEPSR